MVGKAAFFKATMHYSLLRFLPGQRQRYLECLEGLSAGSVTNTCSRSILVVWAERFGTGGLLLGSVGLFLIPFLLMILVDVILSRSSDSALTIAVNILSGLYCLELFHCNRQEMALNALILACVGIATFSGFQWTITFIFLVLFSMGTVYAQKGGASC